MKLVTEKLQWLSNLACGFIFNRKLNQSQNATSSSQSDSPPLSAASTSPSQVFYMATEVSKN